MGGVGICAQVETVGQYRGGMAVSKVEEQEWNARFEGCDALCVEEKLDGTLIARFWGSIGWRIGGCRLGVRCCRALWLRLGLGWLGVGCHPVRGRLGALCLRVRCGL